MARHYIFADEAGCFTFENKPGASKYFILCTVTMPDCAVGAALLSLRRELAWNDMPLGEYFHCCNDKQIVRDAVFSEINKFDFSVQATVLEKRKTQPKLRVTKERFYQHAWLYHFRHGIPPRIPPGHDLLVTAASLGTRKEKLSFTNAIADVMTQTSRAKWKADFTPAASDPCLQVADYCAWAIQRKWESNDDRSFNLIKSRLTYQYDLFAKGTTYHY